MIDQQINNIAFQHPTALVYGKVKIGEGSSLWPYSVIRSEIQEVIIGKFTNIQDFVMIHIGDRTPTIIGDYCSITHRAVIHGASIGNHCLVGVGAIIMDGCRIGDNSIIAAGAVLPAKTIIPENSIVTTHNGLKIKERNNYIANRFNAEMYYQNALGYVNGNHRVWGEPEFKGQSVEFFAKISKAFKERF